MGAEQRGLHASSCIVPEVNRAEWIARENRQLTRRLRVAQLPIGATPEVIDYTVARQWNPTLVRQLAQGLWGGLHQTVIVTGPTGVSASRLCSVLSVTRRAAAIGASGITGCRACWPTAW